MLAHKLNHPVVGAALVFGTVAALSFAVQQKHSTHPAIAPKGDRLEYRDGQEVTHDTICSQAWPYGCGWRLPVQERQARRHSPKKKQPRPWLLRLFSGVEAGRGPLELS
jgi:hypothetical protein